MCHATITINGFTHHCLMVDDGHKSMHITKVRTGIDTSHEDIWDTFEWLIGTNGQVYLKMDSFVAATVCSNDITDKELWLPADGSKP